MKNLSHQKIYSTFFLDNTELAMEVASVQEVVNFPEKVFSMPLAPDYMVGLFNLRGTVIPVINTRVLLNFENAEINPEHKVAIVLFQGAKIGLLFDRTSEILRINEEAHCPFNYANDRHQIVSGALKMDEGKRIIQIIDPSALVKIENIPQVLDQQKYSNHDQLSKRAIKLKKCISFLADQCKMAFEINGIHEICKVPEIKHSALQNENFLGIINLRGLIVPVVNFARLLKQKPATDSNVEDHRIIILKIGTELIGLQVEEVQSINAYNDEHLMPIPVLSGERLNMFKGCLQLADAEVLLLNHDAVFENKEILELTQGHSKMYRQENNETDKKKSGIRQTYISFRLQHLFGVGIKEVREIIEYSNDLIKAPGLPEFVDGMLNLRGKLITVIDTKKLYKMNITSLSNDKKILVFERTGELFGLVVDSVENIVTIDSEKNMKVPELLVKQVKSQFESDIKEIVAIPNEKESETALIILNIDPVTERIKMQKSA